jgi:hypothetical protein
MRVFLWLTLIIALTSPARARAASASLVFVGPGPEIFERFGHVLVRVTLSPQQDVMVDWGRFDFEKPGFIKDFAFGDLRYGMSYYDDAPAALKLIADQGRSVTQRPLNLSAAQLEKLVDGINIAMQPQNREYDYDYFRNNCSTIARDVLDAAVDGQIKSQTQDTTEGSYRWHTRRLTPGSLGNNLLLMLMDPTMGALADRPLSRWEAMYIPMEMQRTLETLTIDRDGQRVPLLGEAEVIVTGTGPLSVEAAAPTSALAITLILCAIGIALLIVGFSRKKRCHLGALLMSAWLLLIASVWSGFMIFFWGFSRHWATQWNENLLLTSPLALVVLVTMWRHRKFAHRVMGVMVLLSLVGLAMKLFTAQENLVVLACVIPLQLATWYALRPSGKDSSTIDTQPSLS